ncbi:MAG: hypothetical protein PHW25_17395 [Zoogloea sp.]|uniref:phage head spike fiber domain-containing protein n=1 Tax=Zoogloea sp. TaxID=49181 RepID=UPI002626E8E0|nr:hypothetical protein [Zoogloea sp.]MDD3328859.1 hypothetical protein [Zoogloea sp.]
MSALDRVFRSRRPSQERPLAAIIAALWRNGEQGVWYDPSALATMFQDASGTLPAYMPGGGQVDPPVGLLLDKRRGLARGQERLTNGDFASTAAWVESGVGVALSAAAGELQITSASPLGAYQQPNNFVSGRWYVVTGQIRVGSAASVSIRTVAGGSSLGTMVAESQVVTSSAYVAVSYMFQATGTANAIYLRVGTTNSTAFFKSLSVRELPGNHAYQTTTTSRPTLSARYNALLASEKFDDAYWGFTSNYAVEKTGDVQDPSGGSNAWKITSTTGSAALNKVVGAGFKNPVYTVILRAGSRNPDILVRNATTTTNLVGGSTVSPSTSGTYGKFTNADLGGGWRKLTIEITSGVATSDVLIVYLGSTGSVATGQYFYVYRADFREGNDGVGLPPYQRVVDANTYDTAGFPLYLKPDGVDDTLTIAGSASSFAFLHNGSGSSIHIAFAPSGGAVYHTLISSGNLGAGTTVGFSLSQDDRSDGRILNIVNNGSGVLHVSQAAVTGVSSARRIVSAINALGVHELRQERAVISPSAVEAGTASQAPASYDLTLFRAPQAGLPQAGLPQAGRFYGLVIREGLPRAAQVTSIDKYLRGKARI